MPVKENSELTLACISEGGNPKPTLTWEVLLSPGVDRHAQKVAAEVLELQEVISEKVCLAHSIYYMFKLYILYPRFVFGNCVYNDLYLANDWSLIISYLASYVFAQAPDKDTYKTNSGAKSEAKLPAVYRAHHNARILCVMEHPTLKSRQNASLLLDVQCKYACNI